MHANAWHCPSCGRRVPRTVDVCRCGSERGHLEALGYTINAPPPTHSGPDAPRPRRERRGLIAAFIGYEIDTDLGAGWRATLKSFFVVAVAALFAATAYTTHRNRQPVRGNIDVIISLQGFTRGVEPGVKNAIPPFLSAAGKLGALPVTGSPADPVRPIDEAELRQGFCSPNLATLVRYEYPGYYDDWSDEKLEQGVLEKRPEYSDRFCMLSSRLDAGPDEVVKYEFKPRSLSGWTTLLIRPLLVSGVFALGCLNVYYRFIIGRLVGRVEDQGSGIDRNAA